MIRTSALPEAAHNTCNSEPIRPQAVVPSFTSACYRNKDEKRCAALPFSNRPTWILRQIWWPLLAGAPCQSPYAFPGVVCHSRIVPELTPLTTDNRRERGDHVPSSGGSRSDGW